MYTSLDLEKVKQMSVDCCCVSIDKISNKRARDVIIGALIVWRHYTQKRISIQQIYICRAVAYYSVELFSKQLIIE